MIKLKQSLKFLMILFLSTSLTVSAQKSKRDLRIWFDKPAADWNNALPVGNGRIGAMVFGNQETERLQLNEESVWTGHETDFHNPSSRQGLQEVRNLLFEGKYAEAEQLAQQKLMGDKKVNATYQTLGDLSLTFPKYQSITDYQRELNLENAMAAVSYRGDGILYKREIFCSAPDQVLVVRLTSEKKNAITFTAKLSREKNLSIISAKGNEIKMTEHVNNVDGVVLYARLKAVTDGGTISSKGGELRIENANTVTLYLTAATDYGNKNPSKITQDQQTMALLKPYEQLKKDHINDYQKYFNRVNLELGTNDESLLPTNVRLSFVKGGGIDQQLIELYYQFGRYMLISSSRPRSLPANLQGIWADGLYPPWSADYHININIQMNYWPAEITNLSELHMPFLNFIDELRPNARRTAKNMYGINGTVAHFSTDVWHYTEPHGKTDWAMWPMGMAWSCMHLWEHYLFTGDTAYLKKFAYPIMREAAEFCNNWLVENPKTHKLVSGPSISPENKFITQDGKIASMVMGPTMDHMIIRDILSATLNAGTIINVDPDLREKIKNILERLSPMQIGSDGRLMEWTEEFKEQDPGHRHISHLYGLFPGSQISMKTPELLKAARKTIDYRLAHGGGHTGWSRAWIINYFARLQDGEAAYENLLALLKKSTLDNLFDNHPPFQIDGNFGATAGITEMLMQSHAGEIHLLPALPNAWGKGRIHGIVARGGFVINIDWENGLLKKVTILSKLGNEVKIRFKDKVITLKTGKEKSYELDGSLNLM
jgi:alpha-L-fucosidase 2